MGRQNSYDPWISYLLLQQNSRQKRKEGRVNFGLQSGCVIHDGGTPCGAHRSRSHCATSRKQMAMSVVTQLTLPCHLALDLTPWYGAAQV